MSTEVNLTPLYGSQDVGPVSSVLDIDGFKILLDCGWAEPFHPALLEPLRLIAPIIDLVVISAPDLHHMGGLPYAVSSFGLSAPIYATNPGFKFGEALLYDAFQSQMNQSDFGVYALEDVDKALNQIVQVKYHQRVSLTGKGEGIELMCYCAGRVVGSAVWKFTKAAETVAYAVDFGHTKDKKLLLNPCDIGEIKRPSVLITDGLTYTSALEEKNQEEKRAKGLDGKPTSSGVSSLTSNTNSMATEVVAGLASSIVTGGAASNLDRFFSLALRALGQGGDVLVPVDTCGRSLDLIHQIEVFWSANQPYTQHRGALPPQHDLKRHVSAPVFFLSNVAYSTIEFAKAQLEWMNDTYADQFCDSRQNIWNLQHVQLIHSMAEITKVSRPRLILASTDSLDSGFSFELFTQLAPLKTTTVLLTSRGTDGSLSELLQKRYISREEDTNRDTRANGMDGMDQASKRDLPTMSKYKFETDYEGVDVLTLYDHAKKVPLEGAALDEYRARKKVEREEWEARKMAEREAEAIRLQEEQKANEEKSIDHGSRIFDLWRGYDLTADSMQKVRARGQHPMFPYIEPRTAFDDYGELFRLPSVLQEDEENRLKQKREDQAQDEDDLPPQEEQVPTAAVIQDIEIPIQAAIHYVDLQGRCDLRSFQNSIATEVQPLSLAFIRAPPPYHKHLSAFFSRLGNPIHYPTNGQQIDVASHRALRRITIEHTTYKDLQFFPLLDYQVAIVSGNINLKDITAKTEEESETKKKVAIPSSSSAMDVDTAAPSSDMDAKGVIGDLEKQIAVLELDKTATSDKEPLFIGDVKLRDFKELLDRHPRGFKTTISGAVLTINDTVTVQREGKAGQSTLVIDGPLCETYFLVRTLLYTKLTNL